MRINNIFSRQFAGIRNVQMRFVDSIGTVIGRNEDGKTTIINLIRSLLFQNAALDDRTDKAFKAMYFPANRQSGEKGDYIDGKICFTVDGKDYSLYKKWGKPPNFVCELETPDGIISDPNKITQVLSQALKYGKGIFDEVICTSQKNQNNILKSLFDSKPSEMKSDLSSIASKVMLETGGISVEKLKTKVQNRIDELAFRWDESLNRPQGGRDIDRAWSISEGNNGILKNYYALRTLQKSEEMMLAYENAEEKAVKAKSVFNQFAKIYPELSKRKDISSKITEVNNRLSAYKDVRQKWPQAMQALSQAERLKNALEIVEAKEIYDKVCEIRAHIDALSRGLVPVDLEDYRMAQILENNALVLKTCLSGMNLTADLETFNGHTATVVSAIDGKPMDTSKGVHEAVVISIPDVMTLSLAPADIDIEKIKCDLERIQNALNAIAGKYGTETLEALSEKLTAYNKAAQEINRLRVSEQAQLGGRRFEDVILTVTQHENIRCKDDVLKDISVLCADIPLGQYISNIKSWVDYYEKSYFSLQALEKQIIASEAELSALMVTEQQLANLSAEYMNITDPKAEYLQLQKLADDAAENAKRLYVQSDLSMEELRDAIEDKRNILSSRIKELKHWRYVQGVLNEVLDEVSKKPYSEIEQRFRENLEFLAGHITVSEFGDSITPSIYSKGNEMSESLLSEGTKETVALAFRLAVIDYLYPNGGGLCIMDDAFVNMDPERCEKACALVCEFAKRHQVIFFTCDCKYAMTLHKEPLTHR